jgi:hypothetical protein
MSARRAAALPRSRTPVSSITQSRASQRCGAATSTACAPCTSLGDRGSARAALGTASRARRGTGYRVIGARRAVRFAAMGTGSGRRHTVQIGGAGDIGGCWTRVLVVSGRAGSVPSG